MATTPAPERGAGRPAPPHGRLADVRISGDFFLEPPEALEAINAGLNGLPADAGELELALAVQSALPADAEMFGFSAEAVAVVLRRALA